MLATRASGVNRGEALRKSVDSKVVCSLVDTLIPSPKGCALSA